MKSKLLILSAVVATSCLVPQGKAYMILDSAADFAVLGGSTVTSTGGTVINGNLGVYPGLALTGFPPGVVNGTTYAGGAIAQQAHNDAAAAYATLAGETPVQNLTGIDLGGLTLTPGVRTFDSSAQLSGLLTLDAQGDAMRSWIFQIGSTLTTAGGSTILLANGAQAGNVYWQVGSSATIGAGSLFSGSILADQSITLNAGADILGRVLALNGAVTLDGNEITLPADVSTNVPEPASFLLLGSLCSVFGVWERLAQRRRKNRQLHSFIGGDEHEEPRSG